MSDSATPGPGPEDAQGAGCEVGEKDETETAGFPIPPRSWVFIWIGIVGFAVVVGANLVSDDPSAWVGTVVGAVGFGLMAAAVGVALAIFGKQDQDSQQQARRVNGQLTKLGNVTQRLEEVAGATQRDVRKLHDTLDGMAHADSEDIASDLDTISNTPLTPTTEEDPSQVPEGEIEQQEISRDDFELLGIPERHWENRPTLIPGTEIPLRPLSILLEGLLSDPERAAGIREPGQLKPSDLGAYRTKSQGPKFWYIVVPIAPGPGRNPGLRRGRSMWRVSLLSRTVERLDEPTEQA